MKPRFIAITIFVSFCWLTHFTVLAQHLDDKELAKGKSDAILAGIDVYKTTIGQAIAKLGQPTKITDFPEGLVAGYREYTWQRRNMTLVADTFFEKGNDSIPYSVELSGAQPLGDLGQTGRGLKLGASLSDVKRIYGSRYLRGTGDNGSLKITIAWEDDTKLVLFFDTSGRVHKMHLKASVE